MQGIWVFSCSINALQRPAVWLVADFEALSSQVTQRLERATTLK